MALYKEITQDDGVVTKYHRILNLITTVNRQCSIAVLSYTDEGRRDCEKDGTIAQPYMKCVTYETEYSPDMNVSGAYEYLKTIPEFEGAIDI